MQPFLIFSSCLFSTVVIHAYHRQSEVYHHIFLAVTILSIIFHCTHNPIIRYIDKVLAHTIFIFIIMDTYYSTKDKNTPSNTTLAIFPAFIGCAWCIQSWIPSHAHIFHFILHIVAILGVNYLLFISNT
jgi:hypothetical protein